MTFSASVEEIASSSKILATIGEELQLIPHRALNRPVIAANAMLCTPNVNLTDGIWRNLKDLNNKNLPMPVSLERSPH